MVQELPYGSYLSDIVKGADHRKRANPTRVRVIEHPHRCGISRLRHTRLLTTTLDQEQAPAVELAARYYERWEIENAFDELKPTSAARSACCAPALRKVSSRKSGPSAGPLRHPYPHT